MYEYIYIYTCMYTHKNIYIYIYMIYVLRPSRGDRARATYMHSSMHAPKGRAGQESMNYVGRDTQWMIIFMYYKYDIMFMNNYVQEPSYSTIYESRIIPHWPKPLRARATLREFIGRNTPTKGSWDASELTHSLIGAIPPVGGIGGAAHRRSCVPFPRAPRAAVCSQEIGTGVPILGPISTSGTGASTCASAV